MLRVTRCVLLSTLALTTAIAVQSGKLQAGDTTRDGVINSSRGVCRIVYPGSELSVSRRATTDRSVAVMVNVWETSVEADFKSVEYREKPDGNAWLEYWNGLTAGTIEGSADDIKITFAEVFPFPDIMDDLKKRIDGITNDRQCRELIEFIETRPIAG
ncbi:hypothetical protein FOZ60_000568, partial [Perkinsus olseni]